MILMIKIICFQVVVFQNLMTFCDCGKKEDEKSILSFDKTLRGEVVKMVIDSTFDVQVEVREKAGQVQIWIIF